MKKTYTLLALFFSCNFTCTISAQIIWNGPLITFSQTSSSGPADQITGSVVLTRGTAQGLYNSATEQGYSGNTSPAGTEWAFGTLANYASLSYANWQTFNGKNPPSMVNKDAVLHLIAANIYIGVKFLSWESGRAGGDGGFSYQRTTASILPVTLKSFNASVENNAAVLQWKTATEINNHHFEIERSTNGTNFISIGKVNGVGNSSIEHAYTFSDDHLSAGIYYYRLAQFDFDGTVHYSSVVLLSSKKNGGISVSPNPAASVLNLVGSGLLNGSVYIIISTTGQTVKRGTMAGQQVNVQELASGQYLLTIEAGNSNQKISTSFIKK